MDSLDFFRRNLKPIMAALTLMAMITFVFDDSLRAGNTTLIPFILAILFGGGAFVWGTRRGKQNEYLAMGALVGAVLGLIIIVFGERDSSDKTNIAGLNHRDITNLKSRRETANRIVGAIYRTSHPIPEQFAKAGDIGIQFHQMQTQRALEQILFKFGNDDFEKDVIFGDLLRREAIRLGIVISDDAVSDYIKMISEQKLSTADFRSVKRELHLNDEFIYNVLRDEIAARKAAEMTFPQSITTPQQRWEGFRKVNVKNSIEATSIPVASFVKGVADPSDTDLRTFFRDHAEKFPSVKGEPGFLQPNRARIAFLKASYKGIEKKVERPTDDEVAKYYEDNREFFIDRTPPKTEKKDDATEGDDAKKTGDLYKPSKTEERITAELDKQTEVAFIDTPLTDVMKFLADYHTIPIVIDVKALEDEGIGTDTPVTRTLTGVKLRSALKIILQPLDLGYMVEDDVLKITTAPKLNEKKTPQTGVKPDENKESDKPEEPKTDKPKPDAPKDESPKNDKPSEPEKSDKPKSDEPKKDTEEKSDSDGSACDEKGEDPKKEDAPKKDDPKADTEKVEKKVDSKPADNKPDAEGEPKGDDKPKSDSADSKPDEATEKKPAIKYKPFDEVKDKIEEDLLRDRTLAEMKKQIEAAVVKMRRIGSYTAVPRASRIRTPDAYSAELKELAKAPKYKSPEEVATELKALAESMGLSYEQTAMVSAEELSELSKSEELKEFEEDRKFNIGSATDAIDDPTNRQTPASVIQRVFGSDSVFSPEVAVDPGTTDRFAYWVVEREETHVPKFDDDGIRDQVLKAWKLAQAAPKAEERAKAVAKIAAGKKLTEAIANETVTGDKEGQSLTVLAPEGMISHFTLNGMSAPGVNPFQGGNERLELSRIAGLDKLGDDFFTGIDKLKPGETAALPNYDRSAFIVVHVVAREDIAAEEDAPQRSDFLKTWPRSAPANQIASFDFDPLRREWMQSIERKYNVKWPVK